MPGSTHGRPLETVNTLSGEVPAPPAVVGSCDVIDENGAAVRPGQSRNKKPKGSGFSGGGASDIIQENSLVKNHWRRVVKHQGWLLKKGGLGVGSAKQWLKRYSVNCECELSLNICFALCRYFVLYGTSQGHFLVYYSDFTECPLYCSEVSVTTSQNAMLLLQISDGTGEPSQRGGSCEDNVHSSWLEQSGVHRHSAPLLRHRDHRERVDAVRREPGECAVLAQGYHPRRGRGRVHLT